MSLKDKPIPADFVPDPRAVASIQPLAELPCARAFELVAGLHLSPETIGLTADSLRVHLSHCQLGLFGYPGHTHGWDVSDMAGLPVPPGLREAVEAAAPLTCPQAWALAARFGVSRMLVGYLAEQCGLKVTGCQLGAF